MAMRQQLLEGRALDHELVSIIIRRYTQSDQESNIECPYMKWRHNMEPEFVTLVLADHEYVTNTSIQEQLAGKDIPYDITSSQMFFLPVPLEEGWIVLMWDMMSRKLHVLDPLIRGDGPSEAKKGKLEMIVWKLHHALFECLNEYYVGWPTQGSQWVTKYPVVAEESFTRDETGGCVLHAIRHYDGSKLKIPLTKYNADKTKRQALHECLKLRGNSSKLVHDAFWTAVFATASYVNQNVMLPYCRNSRRSTTRVPKGLAQPKATSLIDDHVKEEIW
ncbi:hypothetical protein CFC21_018562 [Triticum aestivum]|nr:uncharacterized protein LOC119351848 [Triticum dicoccoides]KAF7003202.1 hypothetical protein CFC21_018562 [Triticum aestivum]